MKVGDHLVFGVVLFGALDNLGDEHGDGLQRPVEFDLERR